MLVIILLYAYIITAGFLVYVIFCGKTECHQGGFIEKVYDSLASCCRCACNIAVCGLLNEFSDGDNKPVENKNFVVRCFVRVKTYITEEPNPLLQLVYLSLMHGNAIYFFYKVFFNINYGVTMYWWQPFLLIAVYITSQVTFVLASFSNPGIITKDNLHTFDVYEYNLAYSQSNCATCGFRKPARSKHCSYLKACVAKYDHYCPWINNTVGEYNYRYFHAFLISNWILCFYGVYTICRYIVQFVVENQLLTARFRGVNGEIVQGSFGLVFQFLLTHHIWLFAQIFFGIAMGFMLLFFWGYHFYALALKNTTTSESFKVQELEDDYDTLKRNITAYDNMIARYKKREKHRHIGAKLEELRQYVKNKQPRPDLSAFYSRGWKHNLRDVMYPPSIYEHSKFR